MEFKDVFRNLRESRGKTQRDVAEAIGVTASAVGQWECGARKPRFDKIQALADYFGVQPNYFLGSCEAIDDAYYIDRAAAKYADFLHKRPEYKVLFDASQKVKPEDIDRVAKMIDLMGGQGNAG